MARDWEKLAGETGEDVPSGRLDRMFRVGRLGVSVGASAVFRKVGGVFRKREPEDERDFLVAQAHKVTQTLGRMKGAAMKLGQILSTDPDMLPPEFVEALTSLQHQAPPMTWRTVREQLEAAFDVPVESVFSFFDPEPIGAASIGQVHRGRLTTGEDVAVKIQYPGIAGTLEADMRNVGSLMAFGRVVADRERLQAYLHEIRSAVLEESNYEAEAENLARFRTMLAEVEGVRVPRPFFEWTRRTVLTMEYIAGTKLDEALQELPADEPRRASLLRRFVGTYSWMLHDRYKLHADPHPGNFIVDEHDNLVFLDFGCVKDCEPRFADGILDILDACWSRDDQRAARLYQTLGFGRKGSTAALFDPGLLREYHEIALEPLITPGPFDFASWDMARRLNRFVLRHPVFLRWVPPAEALMVFRVMGGIKGLCTKVGARLDVHAMALECAQRNGRLTACNQTVGNLPSPSRRER